MIMGVVYKNQSVKSDFSQIRPSRSGFDYERGAFRSDWSTDLWLWTQPLTLLYQMKRLSCMHHRLVTILLTSMSNCISNITIL